METYLLSHNPKSWQWDDLDLAINKLNEKVGYTQRWSSGNTKKIKQGDRVFLIRLGEKPKGIIASGTVCKGVFQDKHWNPEKESEGKLANFIKVKFDIILDPDKSSILTLDKLSNIDDSFRWTIQGSGITIPEEIAEKLEEEWGIFTSKNSVLNNKEKELKTDETSNLSSQSGSVNIKEIYDEFSDDINYSLENEVSNCTVEGGETAYYVTRYERDNKNRQKAISIHGTKCMACGFDFEEIYGPWGKNFIEVHHVKPLFSLEEEVQINPKTDLVCLCSNCHRMVHRKKNCVLGLQQINDILSTYRH